MGTDTHTTHTDRPTDYNNPSLRMRARGLISIVIKINSSLGNKSKEIYSAVARGGEDGVLGAP